MARRMILPLVFGLLGTGVLAGLGLWQLDRLAWKEAALADISARIVAAPVALPAAPDPEADRYLPVKATGRFTGEVLEVLVSRKEIGAGVRVIEAFETEGRRVLVDRGFVADGARVSPRGPDVPDVEGNLHWPDEVDGFTPPPDPKTGLWFARDVPAMAAQLATEPLLIVARAPTAPGIEPMPVDTSGIPNNHLGYAVQWFGLAAVWLGMTAYLLWRIRRRTV
ncbi:SURF1 family protein [Pseudorhodobacter sp. MZDSW-24AT]|uniref:SURF1 family protein n=1 Tax=Pseudorhodobacter sp. MZDSW-24AT TaxID=2052957 RepID=UPI000C1E8312|nr:SURF1 family protein [Pseudorhodobacter sp. MZDSW-24AT]PJF10420.1 SURF1 family protein [Pseudorhodobacter sp. MZDSW-24AT]